MADQPTDSPSVAPREPTRSRTVWEQTLIAAEASDADMELDDLAAHTPGSDEDVLDLLEPDTEALEPEPEMPLESGPEEVQTLEPLSEVQEVQPEEDPFGIPEDLRAFARVDAGRLVIKEPFLDRRTKEEVERRLAPGRAKLVEKRWLPRRREPLSDVQAQVDGLAWKPQYKPRALAWLQQQRTRRQTLGRHLERVPANIIAKRVVYETEGGFVVEVTYRELGQRHHKFFTVVAESGKPTKALAKIQSGHYAEATIVGAAAIERAGKPRRAVRGKTPGHITTYPITNRSPVQRILGIGRKHELVLHGLGIDSTDQFRVRPAAVIARHLGVSVNQVRKWQSEAELMCIKGLGEHYADLLVDAGIRGIDDLKEQEAAPLEQKLRDTLAAAKGTKKRPVSIGRARCAAWIRKAKQMTKTSQPFPAK